MISNIGSHHPGKYIKESLEELEMSQHEFATRLGVTPKFLSTILSGDAKITVDFAAKLSKMFGTSISLWLNLQTNYEISLNQAKAQVEFERELEIFKLIDRNFLVSKGIFMIKDSIEEQILKLRLALPVANLVNLGNLDMFSFYRTTNRSLGDDNLKAVVNSNVWMSLALNDAKRIEASVFDEVKLIKTIPSIRSMLREFDKDTEKKLTQMLNECGIKLVILPYLKNSSVNGLVRWLNDSDNVVVALNGKGKYLDVFWFTFFHEIGHVLQKVKRKMIIDDIDEVLEIKANDFAKDTLIPPQYYSDFVSNFKNRKIEVETFANEIGVHPGIVVGRLQHDKIIGFHQMNDLRQRLEMS